VIVIPAIDLRNGKCVRMHQGDPTKETTYDVDPVERAKAFVAAGARRLHVIDLDGAFGREQCPYDLETIADLQKIPALLGKRGYKETDIENMMHGNWLRFLRKAWA